MAEPARPTPDVIVQNAVPLYLFYPLTPRAEAWVAENIQSDAQWFGNALVVEPRYAWGPRGGHEGRRAGAGVSTALGPLRLLAHSLFKPAN